MSYQIQSQPEETILILPEELGIQSAEPLKKDLDPAFGNRVKLVVQAQRVKQLHTAIFQILVTWKKSGVPLAILDPSDKFTALTRRWGIDL